MLTIIVHLRCRSYQVVDVEPGFEQHLNVNDAFVWLFSILMEKEEEIHLQFCKRQQQQTRTRKQIPHKGHLRRWFRCAGSHPSRARLPFHPLAARPSPSRPSFSLSLSCSLWPVTEMNFNFRLATEDWQSSTFFTRPRSERANLSRRRRSGDHLLGQDNESSLMTTPQVGGASFGGGRWEIICPLVLRPNPKGQESSRSGWTVAA